MIDRGNKVSPRMKGLLPGYETVGSFVYLGCDHFWKTNEGLRKWNENWNWQKRNDKELLHQKKNVNIEFVWTFIFYSMLLAQWGK